MAVKMSSFLVTFTIIAIFVNIGYVYCNPAIATTYDRLDICIENCAQCKRELGDFFEGPLCAESCIKFKGKLIPECDDIASISPFLNKL